MTLIKVTENYSYIIVHSTKITSTWSSTDHFCQDAITGESPRRLTDFFVRRCKGDDEKNLCSVVVCTITFCIIPGCQFYFSSSLFVKKKQLVTKSGKVVGHTKCIFLLHKPCKTLQKVTHQKSISWFFFSFWNITSWLWWFSSEHCLLGTLPTIHKKLSSYMLFLWIVRISRSRRLSSNGWGYWIMLLILCNCFLKSWYGWFLI